MKDKNDSDNKVLEDLVKELDEFNGYLRDGKASIGPTYTQGNYYYAFNPYAGIDDAKYKRDMRLLDTTYRLLDENHINIKCLGYTHLKDAVCIITDMKSMDVCLVKELYPLIARKHGLNGKKGVRKVEHSIRNALTSAYELTKAEFPEDDCMMNKFSKKPTNKMFILKLVQEVSRRLIEEIDED